MRIAEVARFRSHPSPGRDELPVARILHDARALRLVAGMTVGDEDVAVGRNGDARRLVERILSRSANTRRADRHQYFSRRAHLEHLLAHRHALRVLRGHAEDRLFIVGVGHPEIAVRVDGESVRMREEPDAQGLHEFPRRIELQNRRVGVAAIEARGVSVGLVVETAMKHPDMPVRRRVHPDHLAPFVPLRPFHRRGERGPVGVETIRIRQIRFRGRRVRRCLCTHRHGK